MLRTEKLPCLFSQRIRFVFFSPSRVRFTFGYLHFNSRLHHHHHHLPTFRGWVQTGEYFMQPLLWTKKVSSANHIVNLRTEILQYNYQKKNAGPSWKRSIRQTRGCLRLACLPFWHGVGLWSVATKITSSIWRFVPPRHPYIEMTSWTFPVPRAQWI